MPAARVELERLGKDARAQVERLIREGRASRIADGASEKPKHGGRQTDRAALFLAYWRMAPETKALPSPTPEHRFAPPRRWRFDWAWPELLIAVEVDGGRWAPGGGQHGSDRDRDKLNVAAARGWRIFRFAPDQLKREAPNAVALVAAAVREALGSVAPAGE